MFIAKESNNNPQMKKWPITQTQLEYPVRSKLADGYRLVRPTIHCTSVSANIEFTQNCLSRHFFT